jgi:hypothetical protein
MPNLADPDPAASWTIFHRDRLALIDGSIGEDEPARRTYWVFLPPVDRERGPNGIPLFNGSQPVVGVEVRQLTLAPPVARN